MISRSGYYQNIDLRYELVHQLWHRETALLPYYTDEKGARRSSPPIRWLKCDCLKFMDRNFAEYGFLNKQINLYHSLATYKDFPMFSFNWKIKSQEQEIWLTRFKDYILKYDLFCETDSDDLSHSLKDIIKLKLFFDKFGLKYYVKFSGKKGFHVISQYEEWSHIPVKVYDEELEKKVVNFGDFRKFMQQFPLPQHKLAEHCDLVLLFKALNIRLKGILGLDTLDISISDIKRFVKVAYSYDVNSGLIAYPLDDEMLNNFDKSKFTPELIIKRNNYKRGLLWRNEKVCILDRKIGVVNMLKSLEILE